MKRRKFLQTSGASAISLPIFLNGLPVNAISRSRLFNFLNPDSDKVLVLIQLNGGNDGLNTLIPIDQFDNLSNARSNVILPENDLLSIDDTNALHPNMTGLRDLFLDAKVNILQSVGYPNQNRSHFRSTDIWNTGSASDEYLQTGWAGRYFDSVATGFPVDYPNDDWPDPIAITMGNLVSETCQGIAGNFSLALNDPFNVTPLAVGEPSDVPDSPYGDELSFLRTSILQTNAYSDVITDAANNGNNLSTMYPDDNRLAQQLKNIALLISGGLQTKLYVVSLGGFDTHANQVIGGDTTTGAHADLLQTLSDAMAAFMDDLKLLGVDERVVGMTYSEFGRQIRSNDSLGTDHGTAAPLFVFGKCVNPGILGDNPEISDNVDPQEGVPMQFDFRSVYGSILMDWFEVPETEVQNLLYPDFQYIPVLQPCSLTSINKAADYFQKEIPMSVTPNPFRNYADLRFETTGGFARISLFDDIGHEIQVVSAREFSPGEHTIRMEGNDLKPGIYFVRIQMEGQQRTKRMVRQ